MPIPESALKKFKHSDSGQNRRRKRYPYEKVKYFYSIIKNQKLVIKTIIDKNANLYE